MFKFELILTQIINHNNEEYDKLLEKEKKIIQKNKNKFLGKNNFDKGTSINPRTWIKLS